MVTLPGRRDWPHLQRVRGPWPGHREHAGAAAAPRRRRRAEARVRLGQWLRRDGYWEPARSNHVYIQGRWAHDGAQRRYVRGYWQPARPGYVWVPGGYVRVRGRVEWREGYWGR